MTGNKGIMSQEIKKRPCICRDIIVVGAGASGLMAAIHAARCGASVLILEHMERPGKKLLMTGNGRCNFTNEALFSPHVSDEPQDGASLAYFYGQFYHGASPAFVLPAMESFSPRDTLRFFGELGMPAVVRKGGYYPRGGGAAGLCALLQLECERLGIEIHCNIGIRKIRKAENKFIFETKSDTYISKKCILATGGKSYKKTGSDGSGFLYVECFGHHTQDFVPALVPLQSRLAFFGKVAGIRAEISTKIYIDNVEMGCESGELQLTDYGVSGICIFQVSHLAAKGIRRGQSVHLALDFLPDVKESEVRTLLMKRAKSVFSGHKTMAQSLFGLFPEKLGSALLEEAGLQPDAPCASLSAAQAGKLAAQIKHFSVPVENTRSFEQAQVTAGGVDTGEVCEETMESMLVKGLYFAGEMLDIDGICGGFNLQWAWSSGAAAGRCAAASLSEEKKT